MPQIHGSVKPDLIGRDSAIDPRTIHSLHFVRYAINNSGSLIYLVNLLTDTTLTIGKPEMVVLQKWQHHAPTVDEMCDNALLLQILFENDFIHSMNGATIPVSKELPKPQFPGKWLTGFRSILIAAVVLQLLIVAIASILIIKDVSILPVFDDFFWTDDVFTLYISWFVFSYVNLFVHEGTHYLYAKILGAESRINFFSVRINQVVAETEHYYIYTLRKYERILVYSSGILYEATLVGCLLIFIYFDILSPGLLSFARYMVYARLLGIIWQLGMFFKTDAYNVLSDLVDQPNLYEDSLRYLQLQLSKIRGATRFTRYIIKDIAQGEQQSVWTELSSKEKFYARVFGGYFLIGVTQSLLFMVFIFIPRDIELIRRTITSINQANSWLIFLKASLIILVLLWDYIILVISHLRFYEKNALHKV